MVVEVIPLRKGLSQIVFPPVMGASLLTQLPLPARMAVLTGLIFHAGTG